MKIICFKNCKTHLSGITIQKHISYDAAVITPAPSPGGLVFTCSEEKIIMLCIMIFFTGPESNPK